jgi:predicted nucleic acid-binding protein
MPDVVVNTSPLIFLGSAGLLDLLKVDALNVVVPEPVWDELAAPHSEDRVALSLASAPWIRRAPAPVVGQAILAWDLGPGESAVIACSLAAVPPTMVVIDDLLGRRCARSLGIPLRGTLGLVLRAARRGLVADPRSVLDGMRSRGMWLSDAVLDRALREAGFDK